MHTPILGVGQAPRLSQFLDIKGANAHFWASRREGRESAEFDGGGSARLLEKVEVVLFARPIVITNGDFRFVVAEQLRERGVEADIVLEPMRRD